MILIRPSAAIRKNYNEISELCKRTGEPVYLTKNGTGDLVVMDVNAFAQYEGLLRLRDKLEHSEADIRHGCTHTLEETVEAMRHAILDVAHA
ncbi:MAG: type II toxin-antitoxin system Phd/YefM family antitoxin [Lachnospiraceae bacterium]|jgi:PHD/YefM family antitoxin component YafN of YafNO toxin-antitoxin module|nr:type II toxin-antitoxin system Phd/YefM family antitoxin [Lachnospiraceae bacterium]